MTTARTALAAMAGAALLLAGCGGGSSAEAPVSTTERPPITTTLPPTTATTATTVAPATTTTSAIVAAPPELCAAFQDVVALNDAVGESFDAAMRAGLSGDAAEALAAMKAAWREMETEIDALNDLYDRALAVAPEELRAPIVTLQEGTAELWPLLGDAILGAETVQDVSPRIQAIFDSEAAAQATIRAATAALELDEYTVPNCGFRLSNA